MSEIKYKANRKLAIEMKYLVSCNGMRAKKSIRNVKWYEIESGLAKGTRGKSGRSKNDDEYEKRANNVVVVVVVASRTTGMFSKRHAGGQVDTLEG